MHSPMPNYKSPAARKPAFTLVVCVFLIDLSALIDDELILKCKHWAIPMRFAPPKEKADATAVRQALVREELEQAEKAYYKAQAEATEAVKDWFYHRAEARIL